MTPGYEPEPEVTTVSPVFNRAVVIGSEIRHTNSTGSTMDDAASLAREGAPEGLVISTDEQTSGRGRHQRSWESEPGEDLLISILFRPRPAIAVEINMLLALALADLVEQECSTETKLKWPNDVRADNAKVAGILLESVQDANGLSVVAGIGLNVNSRMRDRAPGGTPAVSMRELVNRAFDREQVQSDLLGRIDALYAELRAGGTVVPAWRSKLETLGQNVEVTFTPGSGDATAISGIAEDVDAAGRLIVRDVNGRAWPVAAGEVTLRPGSW